MADDFEIKVDTKQLDRAMARIGKEADDGRVPLRKFFLWAKARRLAAWRNVKATGGTFLGKNWPKFADQYTRKGGRDGTGSRATVPAWGGIPKVSGKGTVKGKKRPSGARVTQSSVQLQDTGRLRGAWTRAAIMPHKLRLGTRLRYAEKVSEKRDNWLQWDRTQDPKRLNKEVRNHLAAILRKHGADRPG